MLVRVALDFEISSRSREFGDFGTNLAALIDQARPKQHQGVRWERMRAFPCAPQGIPTRTPRQGGPMSNRQPTNTTAADKPSLNVVVGIAMDPNDEVVWNEAVRLVRGTEHANLHVCHVLPHADRAIETTASDEAPSILDVKQAALTSFVRARLQQEPPRSWASTQIHIGIGEPAEVLGQLATDVSADVIVVGAVDGGRIRDILVGTVAAELFKSSPCSVVLARPRQMDPLDQSPRVEPPAVPGEGIPSRAHTYHYRRSFQMHHQDANVVPTGLPGSG
jgi:nucleotide-binding universal stress UspA family protein